MYLIFSREISLYVQQHVHDARDGDHGHDDDAHDDRDHDHGHDGDDDQHAVLKLLSVMYSILQHKRFTISYLNFINL